MAWRLIQRRLKVVLEPDWTVKARDHLLAILKTEGGRLSNPKAKSLLSERIEKELSNEEYEEVREQLIGLGFIEKG